MARRRKPTSLPAPWLRRIAVEDWPDDERAGGYPFDVPWLTPDFELSFEQPVTILVGENGSGKSTLLEAIAAMIGFPVKGGGAWNAGSGGPAIGDAGNDRPPGPRDLADRMRAAWLPKVRDGWFLRAGSFETVASGTSGGYLARSHGEGFASLVADRMTGQGVFLMDEPEAALSPRRQAELLAFLAQVQRDGDAQVILATHSPMLMAVPGAALLRITHRGIDAVDLRQTDHFRLWQAFASDPDDFVARALDGDLDALV